MRKKQLVVLLILFAFINVATISMIRFAGGRTNEILSKFEKPWDVERVDGTQNAKTIAINKLDPELRELQSSVPSSVQSPYKAMASMYPQGGEVIPYPVINDYTGGYYWTTFTCIYKGTHGNIWIGIDEEFDSYDDGGTPEDFSDDVWYFGYNWTDDGIYTGNPDYPGGYYLPPGYMDEVTAQDLEEVLYQFDTNIHDTTQQYFGSYADRPGVLGDYKVNVFVFNIKDDFFYNPFTNLGFIMGYFWPAIANSLDTNAFHMDSYQWWRRQGENPPMTSRGIDYSYLSVLAWQYEGTFAHEFQHLINNDVDSDEDSWVDEGMSMLSEYLCGYGISPGHIAEYLIWFWDTPVTIWEGYLSDYGASFLWTYYMYEHYGGSDLIWEVCMDQGNGIEGWSNALANRGIKRSFDQIFQDFAIANYLDDTSFAHGRYGYYGIDIPSDDSEGLTISDVMWIWANYPDWILGPDWTGLGWLFPWQVHEYPHPGQTYPMYISRALSYTPNYVEFYDAPLLFDVTFDGNDFSGPFPTSGALNWHSDGTAWSYFKLNQTFAIPAGGATLSFSNYFSIELDWDYGYVEVHDLDTGEFYTLPSSFGMTTDYVRYVQNNPECPDYLEPVAYEAAGRWNAFTGMSNGVYEEVMDLSFFAGHTIELCFTYWTDEYYQASGWFIDDIAIPELGFYDSVDEDPIPPWIVQGNWYKNDVVVPSDFTVNIILSATLFKRDGNPWMTWHYIDNMRLDDETEEGREFLVLINNRRIQTTAVMVIINQPGFEHTLDTYYTFNAERFNPWWRK